MQGFNFLIPAKDVVTFLKGTDVTKPGESTFNPVWAAGLERAVRASATRRPPPRSREANTLLPNLSDVKRALAEADAKVKNPPPRPFPWAWATLGVSLAERRRLRRHVRAAVVAQPLPHRARPGDRRHRGRATRRCCSTSAPRPTSRPARCGCRARCAWSRRRSAPADFTLEGRARADDRHLLHEPRRGRRAPRWRRSCASAATSACASSRAASAAGPTRACRSSRSRRCPRSGSRSTRASRWATSSAGASRPGEIITHEGADGQRRGVRGALGRRRGPPPLRRRAPAARHDGRGRADRRAGDVPQGAALGRPRRRRPTSSCS